MSEPVDTGGPAFAADNFYTNQEGMTLLDYFAGQAMSQLAATPAMAALLKEASGSGCEFPNLFAMKCYTLAAAMIAEKRRREQ